MIKYTAERFRKVFFFTSAVSDFPLLLTVVLVIIIPHELPDTHVLAMLYCFCGILVCQGRH